MKILSIICCFVIILSCFSITALAYEPNIILSAITTSTDGISEKKEINATGMKRIKADDSLSTQNKVVKIFDELGIDNIEHSDIYAELVSDFDYINSIVTVKNYYETDSITGDTRKISKTECLNKIEKSQSANSRSSVSEEKLSDNGYMSIATTAISKANEALGTYNFIATYDWLKTPITRSTDAISMASNGITWLSGQSNNYYSALFMYNETVYSNSVQTTTTITESKSYPESFEIDGFYFSFDLPNNITAIGGDSGVRYDGFFMMLTAKGRVTNYANPNQMLNVNTKYAHVQIKSLLSVSFSWTLADDPGVTISQGSLAENYYSNYLSWDYSEHYYEY